MSRMKFLKSLVFTLLFQTGFGQVNFETAKSESGIIGTDFVGWNIGYSFSKSEANFVFSKNESTGFEFYEKDGITYRNLDKASRLNLGFKESDKKHGTDFKGTSLKIGVPISDGTRGLFEDGNFNPGLDISYDLSWGNDQFSSNLTYFLMRFSYGLKENKFGFIDTDNNVQIDKRLTQKFGATFGVNLISTWIKTKDGKSAGEDLIKDNFIVAFTSSFDYNTNPVIDLKTKEFVTLESSAMNGFVQETTTAFDSEQEAFFAITPKIDIIWTPLSHKYIDVEETLPRIGLMSSLSSRYNTQSDKLAWNFAIGPSIHPKNVSSRIIAALLAEFNDFNDSTGNKDFDDIFSVNLYIGIPLPFK